MVSMDTRRMFMECEYRIQGIIDQVARWHVHDVGGVMNTNGCGPGI